MNLTYVLNQVRPRAYYTLTHCGPIIPSFQDLLPRQSCSECLKSNLATEN